MVGFPNMTYKSVYVNALSALRSSSVDTSRFSSCTSARLWIRPLSLSRRPWRSIISRVRVHSENKRSMASVSSVMELPPATAIFIIICVLTLQDSRARKRQHEMKLLTFRAWNMVFAATFGTSSKCSQCSTAWTDYGVDGYRQIVVDHSYCTVAKKMSLSHRSYSVSGCDKQD
jgi:hypothetical protein